MAVADFKDKRVLFFHADMYRPGGSERLMVEEVKYFEHIGANTDIITFQFSQDALFNEVFKAKIHQLIGKNLLYATPLTARVLYLPRMVRALRKEIRRIKPDIIIGRSSFECIYLYLATLFSSFTYVTHVHSTISRDSGDLRQFAFIYRKALRKIANYTPGHVEFNPVKAPPSNPLKRIISELTAFVEYLAVRKARKIIVLSQQMRDEVKELYRKDSTVIKGAFPTAILGYKPRQNIREKMGLAGKRIVLNVCRLIPRKRVDLAIKAFQRISGKYSDLVLVIGGTGPEESNLKNIVANLGIEDRVRFIGFVPDDDLWDYYAACDVFVSLDWADFGISAYEALALQKKIVWSTEIETDDYLSRNRHIFAANPTLEETAKALEKALNTEVTEQFDMSPYKWERYCEKVAEELNPLIS
jgi:glycosyltransferase involved in cell wall biosynthesis